MSRKITLLYLLLGMMICLAQVKGAAAKEATVVQKCEVHTNDIVHPRFGGVGFHVFHHVHSTTKEHLEQVIAKRWREMNPSFARLNDNWRWDREMLDKLASHLLRMKDTGTEVYITTWNPEDTKEGEERVEYAERVVDNLEYLVREKGATNIKYYCMTNELSMKGWGSLREDLPKFRDYHQKIFDALKARNLDIKLLASDASPISRWDTIQWATENMDEITGVYGGHHYINDYTPENLEFYSWFLSSMRWGAGMARGMGKDFILGEFGCKQDGRIIDGIRRDTCIYWDTPLETLVGIQLAEAAIAALNGGVYSLCYWTFTDFPDSYSRNYINKWGTFKWSDDDYSTRAHYYAYGLLTRFFRGPATVFRTSSDDPLLRVAAIKHHGKNTYSIAIVNRKNENVPVNISLDGKALNGEFRKYVYDPNNVPWHPFGDLQGPAGKLTMSGGHLTDTVGAGTLTVYTTDYDEQPPAAVDVLKVERDSEGKYHLEWQPSPEPDFCYYRIYRSTEADFIPSPDTRIGSTVANEFLDEDAKVGVEYYYRVTAVDQSGN
jgi:hypothetical protein